MSNKDVASNHGVPKNTLLTYVKKKEKLLDLLEKGSNIKRQKLKIGNFEMVGKAIFNWFLLSTAMIQEKALTVAKKLNVEHFQASDGWLRRWKERNHATFKIVSGELKWIIL